MTAVVEVRDLAVSFETDDGTLHALKGVSLDIAPGEIVALVGESGSGKSVFSSCLVGLPLVSRRTVVTGSVRVAGVDMLDGDDRDRRRVRRDQLGMVFQDPLTSLDPMMRIGDQVCERGADEARGVAALTDCGVPEPAMRMRQWPHALSGGLRQRTSIAGAVTAADGRTPVLLVADEPTTALDVQVQAQIIALFARLRDEHGCSIVLVTHDLGVAAQVADRIAVMYAGEICELGPTAEVLARPRHAYTAKLLDARLDVNKVVARDRPAAPAPAAEDPAEPVLALHDLVKTFRRDGGRRGERFTAVDHVSLSVAPGGSLALVGESGCGKSTVLRMATGLTRPDAGTVEVTGAARPQLVFQDAGSSLTPWLTVSAQLVERLRQRGLSPPRERRRGRGAAGTGGPGRPDGQGATP